MALTKLNSLAIPASTIVTDDLTYPLTNFSSTGIDDNATSTAITIDANEHVGIGITNPDAPLHVKVTEGSTGETDPIARFERFTTGDNHYLDITLDNSTNMIGFQSTGTSNGGFTFGGASIDLVTITSAGNVGINATPNSYSDYVSLTLDDTQGGVLDLKKGGVVTGELWTYRNTNDIALAANHSSGSLLLMTGGNTSSSAMRIDSLGNVAIGTSLVSPIISSTKTLQVASTGNTTLSVRSTDSVNDRSAILELLSSGNGLSKSIILYGDTDTSPSSASPLVFQKYHSGARAEVARFTATGNLRLGDNTPAFIDIKSGVGTNNGGIRWRFNSDSSVYGSLSLPYDTRATTGLHLYSGYPITHTVPGNKAHQFVTGGAEAARIDADGIKFNGDTSAANGLDDYEEGTWTPTPPNGSLTVHEATYTKVGRLVHIRARVQASSSGVSSGDFGGLPFSVYGSYSSGIVGYNNYLSGEVLSVLVQASNLFNFRIGQTQYGIAANSQVMFAATYETS